MRIKRQGICGPAPAESLRHGARKLRRDQAASAHQKKVAAAKARDLAATQTSS